MKNRSDKQSCLTPRFLDFASEKRDENGLTWADGRGDGLESKGEWLFDSPSVLVSPSFQLEPDTLSSKIMMNYLN